MLLFKEYFAICMQYLCSVYLLILATTVELSWLCSHGTQEQER